MTQNNSPEIYKLSQNLHSHNGRTDITAAASAIDLPITPATADVAFNALIRLEAKVDAALANQIRFEEKIDNMNSRLTWVVDTVKNMTEGILASPMGSMIAKRMGQ